MYVLTVRSLNFRMKTLSEILYHQSGKKEPPPPRALKYFFFLKLLISFESQYKCMDSIMKRLNHGMVCSKQTQRPAMVDKNWK